MIFLHLHGNNRSLNFMQAFIQRKQTKTELETLKKTKIEQTVPDEVQKMKDLLADRKRAMESAKNDRTAKKIARGQHVTAAERGKLYKESPDKFRKAVLANQLREATSKRLANANTQLEKSTIIADGQAMAHTVASKGDPELGELFSEAIQKAEMDDLKGKKSRYTSSFHSEVDLILSEKQSVIDMKA